MAQSEAKLCIDRIQRAKGDWFAVLGVDLATATPDDVKSAYKKIVLAIHPDKCTEPGAAAAFDEADKAYKNLRDKEVLDRFQNAHRRKQDEQEFKRRRVEKSALEQWLRRSKEKSGKLEREELESKMSSELTPQERARLDELRAKQEFFFKHERAQRERRERADAKVAKRVQEDVEEEELRDNISNWRSFQANGKQKTGHTPALRQNVGAARLSEMAEKGHDVDDTRKDFLQLRKSWQDARKEQPAAAAYGSGGQLPADTASAFAQFLQRERDETLKLQHGPAAPAPAAAPAAAAPAAAPAYSARPPAHAAAGAAAAGGWTTAVDPAGRTYYWNPQTGQTSWQPPSGGAAAAAQPGWGAPAAAQQWGAAPGGAGGGWAGAW